MLKNLLLLSATAIVLSVPSRAQQPHRCGTMEYLAKQKAADPGLEARMAANEEFTRKFEEQTAGMRTSSTAITIPVVFHILYHTAAQNISDNRIYDQVLTMNKDYGHYNLDTANTPAAFQPMAANTNIQFCLAHTDPNGVYTTGIVRKSVTATGFDPYSNDNVKFSSMGGDDAWDRNYYLNIWVANFTGASTQIIGISQFPGGAAATDGCVIYYGTVGGDTYTGTTASYNLGRTVTHEVGHWLNLRHIWGDDGGACSGSDYVTDTPNQASENYGCPAFPHVSCTNGPNGDMYMNYMDYGDDNCLNMFSVGQGTRMIAALNGPRSAIKTSTRCDDMTGISNPSVVLPFTVYPNPSAGEFVVASQLNGRTDVTVTVSNVLGKTVYCKTFAGLSSLVEKIDLSNQSNGIYLVEVKSANALSTRKVVLSR